MVLFCFYLMCQRFFSSAYTITHSLFNFYWNIVDLHYCVRFRCTAKWFNYIYIYFLMWTILTVFIDLLKYLFLFYILVFWPQNMWNLSSPTIDQNHTNSIGRQSLNQWTTREVHIYYIYSFSEKAMAPRSSTLAWRFPWTEEPGGLQSTGSLRVRHDWATSLSLFTLTHWRRWQSTPVFLPGESQGQGAWWAAVYGVPRSRTRLKWISSSSSIFFFSLFSL